MLGNLRVRSMLWLRSIKIHFVFVFLDHNWFLFLNRTRYYFLLAVAVEWIFIIRSLIVDLLNRTFFDKARYETLIDHGLLLVFTIIFFFHISMVSLFRHPRCASTWWWLWSRSPNTATWWFIISGLWWRGLICTKVFVTGGRWMAESNCHLPWRRLRLLLLVIVVHQISLKLKNLRLILI